jgi:hypothetical protein
MSLRIGVLGASRIAQLAIVGPAQELGHRLVAVAARDPLEPQLVPPDAGKDAFRDMVVDFFRSNSAEYELRVQLCTDTVTMPIEDATVAWPEEDSAHIGVAKNTFPAQNPDTAARRAIGDDVLSFNSSRGLEAHRPLGSINRLKKLVYEASSDFRH